MDFNAVYDTLLDNRKVTAIVRQDPCTYMGISYECFISCKLSVSDSMIPVFIGISEKWEQELVDIYIENYKSFPYIPHVDVKGKICLFDLEGVLIDTNLCGLLHQCVNRAIMVLSDGLSGRNKEDFIKEFDLYWCQLPAKRNIKCVIPAEPKIQIIKYVEEKVAPRRKNEKYAAYIKRMEGNELFAAVDTDAFSTWSISEAQKNGIYFYLYAKSYVYPPDPRILLNFEFINNLLRLVAADEYKRALHKAASDKLFIFQIEQPNGMKTCFGVLIKNAVVLEDNGFYNIKETASTKMYPLSIQRIDKSYLMNRITSPAISLTEKKCLLIGCGSIGGYLVNELIKFGFESITLVDEDLLMAENVFRHFLGIEYIGQYKAGALVRYFRKNIPHLTLNSIDDNIRDLIEDGSIDLAEYDFIISATGNHNINRWINKTVYTQKIKAPVFYVWNEPLDLGCHVAVVKSTRTGCYECFFKRDEKSQELYDSTAYCSPGQNVTKNFTGCGGSFIPYGSTISLKSTVLCMDWINRIIDGRCCDNVLVSLKGDGYYFVKADFKMSTMYTQQSNHLNVTIGSKFRNAKCEVCG